MSSALDLNRYPRTARYIEQLPRGLDSFPECTAKASIHRTVQAHAKTQLSGLPPVLQALCDAPPAPHRWISQCQSHALLLAIVESRDLAPKLEKIWVRAAARKLFSSSMYKILMWAASPQILFKKANMRWSAFYRGGELRAEILTDTAAIDLVAPVGLFDQGLATMFTDILTTAITHTEAATAKTYVELRAFEPGCIHYTGHW